MDMNNSQKMEKFATDFRKYRNLWRVLNGIVIGGV